ncbi:MULTISPECIES: replication initiation protein [unclassified Clostridium]|uniref:replication initiation protein n=1 Tax=unclassified Clostridium TaxID=2614128 RepID=UPI0025BC5E75|nr:MULTISPECIES: replication initiation protein [unclassified Clostridium]
MAGKNDVKRNIAVRSDSIIEARFSLTTKQNDILDMLFTEIQNDEAYQYEISVDKYKHLYKVDTSNLYRDLKKAAKSFEGKGFYIVDKEKDEEIYYVWFSKIHYIPKEGKIKVNIDPDLKKLLYEVKKKIYYDIEYTLNFGSSYSQRMYYYLKSFEDTGWRKDAIENLQRKLDCPKTYQNFANFKKYVLEVCKSEINSSSDIMFDYNVEKTGRKVTHIYFTINKKTDLINPQKNELALDLDSNEIDEIFIKNTIKEKINNEDIEKVIKACRAGFKAQDEILDIREYLILNYSCAKDYYYKTLGEEGVFIAILLSAVKSNWHKNKKVNYKKKSVKSNKQSNKYKQMTFNDYSQRSYDWDKLENQLLGWEEWDNE